MLTHLIIGAGVAGISAAEAIRQSDSSAQITLISDERDGYYSRPGLAYYLTGELPESQLFPYSANDYQRLGAQRVVSRVVQLYPAEREVELHDGRRLRYDRLLLATGARATIPNLPGINAPGVVKLDHIEDARKILKLSRKARSAVVVGGGITALELVEGLLAQGIKPHYLMRGERYWSNVLDEGEARLVEARLMAEGVQIHYRSELEEVLVKRDRVQGVRTQDGRQIRCDLLAVAIGNRPRVELARQAGLKIERGILVDEFLGTSAAGVYAAGDVAQVYDPLTGQYVLDSLWNTSRQQGMVAGRNMASASGNQQGYRKPPALNVTRLAHLTTTIIGAVGRGTDADLVGIVRGDSETWRYLVEASPGGVIAAVNHQDVNRVRVLVGKTTLLGAVVMGDQTLSAPLQHLVSEQINITPIRERLLQPGAPIGILIAEFWKNYVSQQS